MYYRFFKILKIFDFMIYMWLELGVIIMVFLLVFVSGLIRYLVLLVIDWIGMLDDLNLNFSRVKKY